MNHQEMTTKLKLPAGYYPSDCPGELAVVGTWPDRSYQDGILVDRVITVSRCTACEARISAVLELGLVLNHYPGPKLSPGDVLDWAASAVPSRPRAPKRKPREVAKP